MNHAVALAIIDTERVTYDSRILVGLRSPKSNQVHPNVVSVPTQRVPDELFGAIKARIGLAPFSSEGRAGSNPVAYAVQSVLTQKLGLADCLELEHIHFSAAARTTFEGVIPVLSEGEVAKPWAMAIIEVHLSGRWFSFADTASYAGLNWVRVDELLMAVDGDGFLREGDKPLGGLCIESTAKWLSETLKHA